jgi:hypothetical protein
METIDLPIHIPTAIVVTGVFLALWFSYFVIRRRRVSQPTLPETKAKRRYTKKRAEPQEPVAQ